ncbi:OB-fold protein [Mangrovimonas spongiae]|uniref:tRNA_anti-like n=1 Tax=Mangrovimonas spongiae TaxID=2494697 RepID=A0A3R9PJK5_9FLAO|nr:hypothetical protein [Mangrovimonas spongiae]RSK39704.1 hypothetical protein EJA19_07400 [Mangrovimonas spongiae]
MKKIGVILIILIVGAVIGYNYVFKNHRNIETEKAQHTLTSKQVANEFSINPNSSQSKYLNKTIEVSGVITEINPNEIVIDNTIVCLFKNLEKQPKLTQITIKGRFIGYDDLLEQVKLDQCIIINY